MVPGQATLNLLDRPYYLTLFRFLKFSSCQSAPFNVQIDKCGGFDVNFNTEAQPKRGRGGMVDATDLSKLSLDGEICQVDALKFRETYV